MNPPQAKALQGRKRDGREAKRIAEFLQDGRLDPSFVLPKIRHRLRLLHQRNEVHNQIRGLLEKANVKLSSVASDWLGVSVRRIIGGEDSPELPS